MDTRPRSPELALAAEIIDSLHKQIADVSRQRDTWLRHTQEQVRLKLKYAAEIRSLKEGRTHKMDTGGTCETCRFFAPDLPEFPGLCKRRAPVLGGRDQFPRMRRNDRCGEYDAGDFSIEQAHSEYEPN